jgi:ribosomal protein L32
MGLELVSIMFFCGLSAGIIGKIKGSSFFIWFLIGAALPIAGTLAALFYRWEGQELLRKCEECGNVVALSDQVCMRCGRDLDWPEQVYAPRPAR